MAACPYTTEIDTKFPVITSMWSQGINRYWLQSKPYKHHVKISLLNSTCIWACCYVLHMCIWRSEIFTFVMCLDWTSSNSLLDPCGIVGKDCMNHPVSDLQLSQAVRAQWLYDVLVYRAAYSIFQRACTHSKVYILV